MSPCRARGRHRPARRTGRRSARRRSGAARTRRRAPGAPSRTRRRCGRSGPQATTSLRNGWPTPARSPRRAAWHGAAGPTGSGAPPAASPPAGGRARRRPRATAPAAERVGRGHARTSPPPGRRRPMVGGTSCLLRPRCPPPWTSATRSVRTGAPPSGATVPTTASATMPAATTSGTDERDGPLTLAARVPSRAAAERGEGDPAGPDAGGDQERPAEAGQLDQRAAGLARGTRPRAAVRRRATSCGRPRPGCTRRRRPSARPRSRRRGGRGRGEEERLDEDEDDRAVPVEGAGPGEPDGVAAQPGQPPGPDAGPQRQAGQAPVEQRRPDEPRAATSPTGGARARAGRPPRPRGRRRGPGAAGRSQERVCRSPAAGDAGGDADAVVGRAGHGDAAEAGQRRLDAGRAQEVVHPVLRERVGDSAPPTRSSGLTARRP